MQKETTDLNESLKLYSAEIEKLRNEVIEHQHAVRKLHGEIVVINRMIDQIEEEVETGHELN